MTSINARMQSRVISAGVDLARYEGTQRRAIRAMLEKLRRELITEVADNAGRTVFGQDRLAQMLAATNAAINDTYQNITQDQLDKLADFAKVQQRIAEGIVNNTVGVQLIDTTFTDAELRVLAEDTLIEGAPSAEWWARAGKGLRERFADSMRQGVLRGETLDQLVARVQDPQVGLMTRTMTQAEAIVRSSVQTVANVIKQDVYKKNRDLFDGIQWVSTLDDRTTDICMALDGASWDMDYNPIGPDTPDYPGATAHWGCRSTQVPLLKSWSDLVSSGDEQLAEQLDQAERVNPGTRASMDGQVPDTTRYEDWLSKQSEARQIDILGESKYDLWKNGDITLRDLIDQSGNPLTLAQLEGRHSTANQLDNQVQEFIRRQGRRGSG